MLDQSRPFPPTGIERERFLSLAFCWAELVLEVDLNGRLVLAEGAAESLLGQAPEELYGRPIDSIAAPEDLKQFRRLLETAWRSGHVEDATIRLTGAKGPSARLAFAAYRLERDASSCFLAFRRYRPVHWGDNQAGLSRDEDTGLFEANAFLDVAFRRIAENTSNRALRSRMTLIGLHGYDALREYLDPGSEQQFLEAVGGCLRAGSLDADTAGRVHGDRYAFLHNASLTVELVRKRLEKLIRDTVPFGADCTVEAMTVDIDDDGMSPDLIAKGLRYTTNRFRHDPLGELAAQASPIRLSQQAGKSVEASRLFEGTITTGDFTIAFQPIVDVATGAIHHYEALARFPAHSGVRSAYEQITFAEDTGLIADFDLAMARKAIGWLAGRQNRDAASVAVNMSGMSVGSLSYLARLDGILAANPWLRGRLMFEITESVRMERLGPANTFIRRLRELGFPVCLDDFGSGAANFRYLSRLEVDIVKLDGHSLNNARKERTGKAFLKALVSLCGELGIATIAEMIEDEAGLDFVRDCGVQYVQGHLFGRPANTIDAFTNAIPRHLF